jgi:glycerate-2-kinase
MEKYDIRTDCGLPECQVIETPKEQKFFQRVDTFLCLTNKVALEAMAEAAQERGYVARIESTEISGEARNIGAALAVRARKERGTVLLYGGETTVTVQGAGKGGRNQEVVLGGLSHMDTHTTLLAAASDGWDNSDVAGALGDSQLFAYAQAAGNKTDAYLKKNASYEFFLEHGGHLKTGKTGTNVADLYFTLTTK